MLTVMMVMADNAEDESGSNAEEGEDDKCSCWR